ncbi:MAG: hypothetical protein IJ783_06930 [Kiritimatiellae bacterium]|nr:hypothetical protein [Kiritimatiellia bacterium]
MQVQDVRRKTVPHEIERQRSGEPGRNPPRQIVPELEKRLRKSAQLLDRQGNAPQESARRRLPLQRRADGEAGVVVFGGRAIWRTRRQSALERVFDDVFLGSVQAKRESEQQPVGTSRPFGAVPQTFLVAHHRLDRVGESRQTGVSVARNRIEIQLERPGQPPRGLRCAPDARHGTIGGVDRDQRNFPADGELGDSVPAVRVDGVFRQGRGDEKRPCADGILDFVVVAGARRGRICDEPQGKIDVRKRGQGLRRVVAVFAANGRRQRQQQPHHGGRGPASGLLPDHLLESGKPRVEFGVEIGKIGPETEYRSLESEIVEKTRWRVRETRNQFLARPTHEIGRHVMFRRFLAKTSVDDARNEQIAGEHRGGNLPAQGLGELRTNPDGQAARRQIRSAGPENGRGSQPEDENASAGFESFFEPDGILPCSDIPAAVATVEKAPSSGGQRPRRSFLACKVAQQKRGRRKRRCEQPPGLRPEFVLDLSERYHFDLLRVCRCLPILVNAPHPGIPVRSAL